MIAEVQRKDAGKKDTRPPLFRTNEVRKQPVLPIPDPGIPTLSCTVRAAMRPRRGCRIARSADLRRSPDHIEKVP